MKLLEAWPETSTPSSPLPRAVVAAGVEPDEVIHDEVAVGVEAGEADAVARVARDDVGLHPDEADVVAARGGIDGHAVAGVGQGVLAVDVGADVDAEDIVVASAAGDQDAVAAVVRDDLGGRRGAADDVVGRRRRRWPRR